VGSSQNRGGARVGGELWEISSALGGGKIGTKKNGGWE